MSDKGDTLVEALHRLSTIDASGRAAALAEIRHRSPAMADELESLLAAHEQAEHFLETFDAAGAVDLLRDDERLLMPERAGNYRLIREIGRGGLGVVYLAERVDSDFDQRVAIKLVKHGMDSESILRRFQNERRILASLEHDNIARLIDGGLLEDGRPWFAMEYIEGVPITAWCDQHSLSTRRRLELFEQICRAVQHAHARLVIHRDLKPDNILVTQRGTIKLLDFGIAKLLAESADDQSDLTTTGIQAMTPEYAAPEQVRGEPVSVETDVYALGVVLYQLLTGRHPFADGFKTREQLNEAICRTSPEPPSTAIARANGADLGRRRTTRSWALQRQLRGDLDAVVLTALAKDRKRRYGSVEALAEDIRRHLANVPIRARRRTAFYRTARYISRHRLGLAATGAVMLALVIGLSTALWQAGEARKQAAIAEQSRDFVVSLLRETSPVRSEEGLELRAVDLLRHAAERVETREDIAADLQARLRIVLAVALLDLGDPASALPLAERGVDQIRSLYGPDSEELSDGLYALARIQADLGDSDAAAAAANRGLATLDRLTREPSLLRVRLLGMVARARNLEGNYSEALPLRQRILEERRKLFAADDPGLAPAHYNLATTAYLMNDLATAERNYREAGRLIALQGDANHPRMAYIHMGIGTTAMDQGRLQEADSALMEAMRVARERIGPESVVLNNTRMILGRLRREQGRLPEARELLQDAVELHHRLETSHNEAVARSWLSLVLLSLQQTDKVYAHVTAIQKIFEQTGNRSHPHYGLARMAHALAIARSGAEEEAIAMAAEAMEHLNRNGHQGTRMAAEASELYASVLEEAGMPERARQWHERTRTGFASALGENHPRTLAAGSMYSGRSDPLAEL